MKRMWIGMAAVGFALSFLLLSAHEGMPPGVVAAEHPEPVAAGEVPAAAQTGLWHRVREGETLRSLANRYYGSPRQWRTLQIANNAPARPPVDSLLWIPGLRDEMDSLSELGEDALTVLE